MKYPTSDAVGSVRSPSAEIGRRPSSAPCDVAMPDAVSRWLPARAAAWTLLAACGPTRSDSEPIHQATTSAASGSEAASSSATLEASGGGAGSTTDWTATSGDAATGGSTGESGPSTTTGEAPPLYEVCPTATDEASCVGLNPRCRWIAIYDVLSSETCEVSEPAWGCWAMVDPDGPQGCFGYFPTVCQHANVGPAYRVVEGITQVANVGACQLLLVAPPDEAQWVLCPDDEFQSPPPECYCLCG